MTARRTVITKREGCGFRAAIGLPVIIGVLLFANISLALDPVIVAQGTDSIVLGRHVEYLEEPQGKWSIEDVTSAALSSRFVRSEAEVPSFGFSTNAYWFRFRLKSEMKEAEKLMLEIAYPVLDHIECYSQKGDGGFEQHTVGEVYPYGNKLVRHHNFILPIRLAPQQSKWIYLRVKNKGALQVPLSLWTTKEFVDHTQGEQLFYGTLMGFLLAMALYNLFMFFPTRDRSHLFYVLLVISAILYEASVLGLAQEYIWPQSPWLAEKAYIWFGLGFLLLIALYIIEFLNLPRLLPVWNRIFQIFLAVCGAGILAATLMPYRIMVTFMGFCVFVGGILSIGVCVFALARGFKSARYLLAGGTFLGVSFFMFVANKLGLIPRTAITENSHLIGHGLTMILLSLALADRINQLRQDKERMQKQALEVQRLAAETLEQEVQNRTQELKQAYDRLSEHDRLKSRFFANVSHELRTPLTLILTPLERLLIGNLVQDPENVRQQLRSMAGNTHRLLRLVNQLLDFSRLESGAASVAYELRDIGEMVKSLVQGFVPFARSKELKLELRAQDKLSMAYVDPAKLDKIVSNLLSNACKFTERGGTVLVLISSDDQALKVAIKDTGIGIAEKDLSKIFERFRQVDGSAARRYEGTGIGLSLSKELVELMGGKLEVNSDLGLGSTFTVTLPLGKDHIQDPSLIRSESGEMDSVAHARAAATAMAAERGMRRDAASSIGAIDATHTEEEDQSRPLLLVVEDNPDMRALVAEICQEDFSIIEAENGRIGLDKIRQHHPALVVLDVMMPEMDGHEVLRRVRSDPAIQSIPIILLTAKAGPEMRLDGLESGADDYLSKPFESRELLARARNIVRLQRQERQLREINSRLQQEVVERSTALEKARSLQRYLPPDVARSIMEGSTPVQVGQQLCRLTCFRLELRGFDRMVEQAEPIVVPEDMASMLNAYLSEMMEVAFAHGATVDKFIRDTVVGFFGAPKSEGPEQDAVHCAKMAQKMWERAVEVCRRWRGVIDLQPPQPTMILSSGHATVGNFGSSTRLEYTAMGGPVDETSALIATVTPGAVACSQATWILIKDRVKGELIGEVTLRGGARPVKLYRIAGPSKDIAPAVERTQPILEPETAVAAGQQPDTLSTGMRLARRYEIVRPLGEGGMGTVYKARDLKLGTDVALKLLKQDVFSDDSRRARIYKEVRLAQLVSHRNVARIYDLQAWEGFEFISMEFIQGQTLAERLKAKGALPEAEGLDVLRQTCAGLAAAHAANIIHQDLKPSNIMLEQGGRVVIMDFGTARWDSTLQETKSSPQSVIGSPIYMAPEQFEGFQVDQRTDIYALGVVAFEMFTGQVPFDAKTAMALAYKHTHEKPPDPAEIKPNLQPRLAAVIHCCLEKVPARRFGSVVEITSLLDEQV